jgi:hypothetical protein
MVVRMKRETLTQYAVRPGDDLETRQLTYWPGSAQITPFTYDMTIRAGLDASLEHDEILDELLRDDVYALLTMGQPGDVWIDAGCHAGTFSIAAMMHGYDVAVMVDMDEAMAWCAEVNARAFLYQQVVREDRKRVRPVGWVEEITSAGPLVEMGMLTRDLWEDRARRSCLKLDVQGAEVVIFADGGLRELATAFDLMVFEWHDTEVFDLFVAMDDAGWRIVRSKTHTDVLLNTDTRIVWAVSG